MKTQIYNDLYNEPYQANYLKTLKISGLIIDLLYFIPKLIFYAKNHIIHKSLMFSLLIILFKKRINYRWNFSIVFRHIRFLMLKNNNAGHKLILDK